MKKKNELSEIENRVLEILENEFISLSIRAITLKLEEKYGIKKSPQIIKKVLILLKKKGKIE